MRAWLRKWWPFCKILLALAILVAIGRRFARDLQSPDLWELSLRPGWLVVAGLLYLAGLGFSNLFWYRLLRSLRQSPTIPNAIRAYYIGHLGKYLPGKAWSLLLRTTLARGAGVGTGVAALTTFYEVLATMAGGVLLALVWFSFQAPESTQLFNWNSFWDLVALQTPDAAVLDHRLLVLLSLVLLLPVGLPILPPVFNRLVHHLSVIRNIVSKTEPVNPASLPRIRFASLLEGLFLTALGWSLLGASLWAVLRAILPDPPEWSWQAWGQDAAITAIAYVAGFVIVVVPSGLGVREYFLTLFLVAQMPGGEGRALAVLTVLVLRLVWTAAELVMAGIVYWLPSGTPSRGANATPLASEVPVGETT